MTIKKFIEFNESISGTEITISMGPNYGPMGLPHSPDSKDTNVIYSKRFGKIFTQDQYQELYQSYLKLGGTPMDGFTLPNLELVLSMINSN